MDRHADIGSKDTEEKKERKNENKIEGITRRDKRIATPVGQLAHRTDEERTYEILFRLYYSYERSNDSDLDNSNPMCTLVGQGCYTSYSTYAHNPRHVTDTERELKALRIVSHSSK